ncbi:MAG TPA: hypothetical protein VJO99_06955 [Burkholderiaceae bacterium]|nr:hypothetical protein [Burkholderiaceae bacterium]
MPTPTTLALPPRGAPVRPGVVAPAGWRERLSRLWRQMFGGHERDTAAAEVPGHEWLESLAGLDERLLADIGAPEPLQDRARRGGELRQQRLIELERGYRTLGWRW